MHLWIFLSILLLTTSFTATGYILNRPGTYVTQSSSHHQVRNHNIRLSVSSGFSFDDGQQVLVSVQKPLGIVLEQDLSGPVKVVAVDPNGAAGSAGIKIGDVLLAVQNASVERLSLEEAMDIIGRAPRVVNLRFLRSG